MTPAQVKNILTYCTLISFLQFYLSSIVLLFLNDALKNYKPHLTFVTLEMNYRTIL